MDPPVLVRLQPPERGPVGNRQTTLAQTGGGCGFDSHLGHCGSPWSSPECSPPCHGGGRGFKSHRGRFAEGGGRRNIWGARAARRSARLMARWWNGKTRDAQNVVPSGVGVRLSPWSLRSGLEWLPARSHKPFDAGSNPASATDRSGRGRRAEYANRQSGQVESLVSVCGFDSHLGHCAIPWSSGNDPWLTTR